MGKGAGNCFSAPSPSPQPQQQPPAKISVAAPAQTTPFASSNTMTKIAVIYYSEQGGPEHPAHCSLMSVDILVLVITPLPPSLPPCRHLRTCPRTSPGWLQGVGRGQLLGSLRGVWKPAGCLSVWKPCEQTCLCECDAARTARRPRQANSRARLAPAPLGGGFRPPCRHSLPAPSLSPPSPRPPFLSAEDQGGRGRCGGMRGHHLPGGWVLCAPFGGCWSPHRAPCRPSACRSAPPPIT